MALTTAQIQQAYVTFFSRPADAAGLNYWSSYGGSVADLYATFAQQTEYTAAFSNLSSAQKVNVVYQNLFGRDAEPTGLLYWAKALDAGSVTVANLALAVSAGSQGTDGATVANRVTAATAFTAALDTTAKILGYSGTAANASAKTWLSSVVDTAASLTAATAGVATAVANTTAVGGAAGSTFTLTTGVDSLVGTSGNDTFVVDNTATAKTMTVADAISGGAGSDTLRVFLQSTDTGTGEPTLSSIENVYINGGAITAYTPAASVTSLTIDKPVALTNATYTLTGAQAISLTSALTASAAATMTTTLAYSATTAAANATLSGYTYSGTDKHTLAVTGTTLATLNLTSTGSANKVNSLTNASAALTKLTVAGDKGLTLTDTLTGLKTYDASVTTGGFTLDISGKTPSSTLAYTGGSGRDIVTMGAGAAGPKSTMALDGGAGSTDKLVIKDTDTSNSAGINKAVGFEYLGLGSGTANSTYDMSVITSMSIVNIDTATGSTPATTATAATGNAGTAGTAGISLTGLSNANTLIIDAAITSGGGAAGAPTTSGNAGNTGGAGAVGLSLAPSVDNGSNAISITLNGVTIDSSGGAGSSPAAGGSVNGGTGGAGAVSISATNYENVTIVSNFATDGTTTNVLKATGGAAGTPTGNGTGTAGADAAGLAVGSNATVTITGAAALNAGLISGTNVTVNASALSGNFTASTGTGNDVITGGSGVNTITLTGGVDTVNISASTAKADVVAITSATGTTSTNFVQVTGFTNSATVGDKLDVIGTGSILGDVAAGAASGVTNLTFAVTNGVMTFAGTAAATATLANKITAAFATTAINNVTAKEVAFEHNGSTYIVESQDTTQGFNAGTDLVVQLVGVTGVTALSTTASGATTIFVV